MKKVFSIFVALVMAMSMISTLAMAEAKPVEITIKLKGSSFWEEQVELFNQTHDNIHVNLAARADTTDNERNQMMTMLSAESDEVDILLCDTCWIKEFAAAGWLEPAANYLPEGYNDDFFPAALDLTSLNGIQYGVLCQTDISALFYRTDLFEAAGLKPPTTWDELIEVGTKLNSEDAYGFVWQGKQYEGLVCDWVEILHSLGGKIVSDYGADVGQREVTIDSEAAVKATEYMKQMLAFSPEGVLSYSENDSRDVFVAGKAAMLRLWQSTPSYLIDPEKSAVVDKWGVTTLPGGEAGSTTCLGGWARAINVYSEHKAEAAEVLQWFCTADYQAAQFLSTGNAPSRLSAYENELILKDPLWSGIADLYREIGKTGVPRPLTVVWSQESDVIQRALHSVFTDAKDAATAMKDAAAEIKAIEDSYAASVGK